MSVKIKTTHIQQKKLRKFCQCENFFLKQQKVFTDLIEYVDFLVNLVSDSKKKQHENVCCPL